jgi:hypothetical protein
MEEDTLLKESKFNVNECMTTMMEPKVHVQEDTIGKEPKVLVEECKLGNKDELNAEDKETNEPEVLVVEEGKNFFSRRGKF